jgi:DNA-binding beta-propeller fold protein YncE
VAVFSRNKTTGVLTQLAGTSGCVSDDGTGGACVHGRVLLNARSVAVSPDGKHVYATSHGSEAVVGFSRNHATGALTQLSGTAGCVKETPVAGDCTAGRALHGPSALTVSPDGKHVYVASSFGQSVAVLSRNKTTGAVTQLVGTDGCVSEDGTGGDCADGKALSGATSVAVSPDGKHVYVASNFIDAVAVFSRNKATGVLTQLAGTAGCVSEDGTGGSCVDGKALGGPFGVTVSNDGKQVYAVSASSSAVAIFSRQK